VSQREEGNCCNKNDVHWRCKQQLLLEVWRAI